MPAFCLCFWLCMVYLLLINKDVYFVGWRSYRTYWCQHSVCVSDCVWYIHHHAVFPHHCVFLQSKPVCLLCQFYLLCSVFAIPAGQTLGTSYDIRPEVSHCKLMIRHCYQMYRVSGILHGCPKMECFESKF